jgi:hypothetical protein
MSGLRFTSLYDGGLSEPKPELAYVAHDNPIFGFFKIALCANNQEMS